MGDCQSEQQCCCPCHSKQGSCYESKQEHHHCHEDEHEHMGDGLLAAADCAWMEVLKDKIKEHILATRGDQMTELAKIVAEGNNQRWKHKMEKKHHCADFKEKLCQFFGKFKK